MNFLESFNNQVKALENRINVISKKLEKNGVKFQIVNTEDNPLSKYLWLYWNDKSSSKFELFEDWTTFKFNLNHISGIRSKDIKTQMRAEKKLEKLLK
jgi:hypothetical protein